MSEKDYGGWHARKIEVNKLDSVRYFYEREVWWLALGQNVGSEEDGKGRNFARPVLVVVKFNLSLFFGVPLSTTNNGGKYYYPLTVNRVSNKALLSQLRAFDAKRLINKIDVVDEKSFNEIRLRLVDIIKPPLSQG